MAAAPSEPPKPKEPKIADFMDDGMLNSKEWDLARTSRYYNVQKGLLITARAIKSLITNKDRQYYFLFAPDLRLAGTIEALNRYITKHQVMNSGKAARITQDLQNGQFFGAANYNTEPYAAMIEAEYKRAVQLSEDLTQYYLNQLDSIIKSKGKAAKTDDETGEKKKKEKAAKGGPSSHRGRQKEAGQNLKGRLADVPKFAAQGIHRYIDITKMDSEGVGWNSTKDTIPAGYYHNPMFPNVITKDLTKLQFLLDLQIPGFTREMISGFAQEAPSVKVAKQGVPLGLVVVRPAAAPVVPTGVPQIFKGPVVPVVPMVPTVSGALRGLDF